MYKKSGLAFVLCVLLGVVGSGCASNAKFHPCAPIPNGVATCLSGVPVSWSDRVVEKSSDYYAPVDELASTMGARAEISADKKRVTINGKDLSMTNGVTNMLEQDGKVYVIILDAANAAGYSVVLNFAERTVNIVK